MFAINIPVVHYSVMLEIYLGEYFASRNNRKRH